MKLNGLHNEDAYDCSIAIKLPNPLIKETTYDLIWYSEQGLETTETILLEQFALNKIRDNEKWVGQLIQNHGLMY